MLALGLLGLAAAAAPEPPQMVTLDGGRFDMGAPDPPMGDPDQEGPVHAAAVRGFRIDALAVTNEQFRAFVRATKYRTEAETFGWSFVLELLASDRVDLDSVQFVEDAPWWIAVNGAYWRAPDGPGSGIKGRERHPAVHISWNDAAAYCAWRGARLPTEAEWEFAARGGLAQQPYPWGDAAPGAGAARMNVWQGEFPTDNSAADGWRGTAPADAFEPNAFGVFNAVGNVWEWVDEDFVVAGVPEQSHVKVLRGGSFVDSVDGAFNHRARVTTRMGNTADSSGQNTGFRCAESLPVEGPGAVEAEWASEEL